LKWKDLHGDKKVAETDTTNASSVYTVIIIIIIIIIIKYICKAHFRDAANALKQQLHSEQKCLQLIIF